MQDVISPKMDATLTVGETFSSALENKIEQEDHDGPVSLTWANRFAYLLLKFQPSFLYKFYSPFTLAAMFF